MLLYERTRNLKHDWGLIFEIRPKKGHFGPFFVWQFWAILRQGSVLSLLLSSSIHLLSFLSPLSVATLSPLSVGIGRTFANTDARCLLAVPIECRNDVPIECRTFANTDARGLQFLTLTFYSSFFFTLSLLSAANTTPRKSNTHSTMKKHQR